MADIRVYHIPQFKEDAPYELRFPEGTRMRFHCLQDADQIKRFFSELPDEHVAAFEKAIVTSVTLGLDLNG